MQCHTLDSSFGIWVLDLPSSFLILENDTIIDFGFILDLTYEVGKTGFTHCSSV